MADADRQSPIPADWSTALGALPLSQAPEHAWSRLAEALPDAPRDAAPMPRMGRPSLRRWLSVAASIAVALPFAWWLGMWPPSRHESTPSAVSARVPTADADPSVAPSGAPRTAASTVAPDSRRRLTASATGDAGTPVATPASRPAAAAGVAARPRAEAEPRSVGMTPQRVATDIPETRTAAAVATATRPSPGIDIDIDIDTAAVDRLQQESARLEALLALARDDRMASAPAAVLSAALGDRIGLIDAALTQPGLDAATRSSLWSKRVEALQDLASLEGTRRWMAAHGASMDAVARVD